MKQVSLALLIWMLTSQFIYSQITFKGEINLNQKDRSFYLISESDSLSISFEKKEITFKDSNNFQLIRTKNKEYKLVLSSDTLTLIETKKTIEYSNGLSFNISTKKAHQIELADKEGKTVLDAQYSLKGNIATFFIEISDNKYEFELLAYATKYLYELSLNEVNTIVPFYFFMY